MLLIAITVSVIFIWPGPTISGTPSDLRIRSWGMCLQLIGAFSVWYDLTTTARDFGESGILQRTWHWLKVGVGRQQYVMHLSGAAFVSSGGNAWLRQRPGIKSNSAIEDRVAVLEKYVGFIDKEIGDIINEIRRREMNINKNILEKTSELADKLGSVKSSLKTAVTGNYSALLFGASWIIVGIVISSLAVEFAKLVGGHYMAVWNAL